MSVSFEVRLDDGMSGPAKAAASSVNALASSCRKAAAMANDMRGLASAMKQAKGAGSGSVRKQADDMFALAKKMKQVREERRGLALFSKGLPEPKVDRWQDLKKEIFGNVSVGTMLGNIVSGMVQSLFAAGAAAVRFGVQMVAAFGQSLAKAMSFREQVLFSLTRFLGGAATARSELAKVMELSNRLGMDFQTTAENFKDLVSANFSADAAREMLALKADLQAMSTGTAESMARIEEAFGHIQKAMAAGRMEADQFNQILSNLPVTKRQIMDKLSGLMGKSVEQLMKMDITKLPIDKLVEAIKQATLEATKAKALGETALAKQFSTVSGAWQAFKNILGNIPDRIAAMMEKTDLGKFIRDSLRGAADWVRGADFDATLQQIADGLKTAGEGAKAFAEGFGKGFAAMGGVKALSAFMKGLTGGDVKNMAEQMRTLGAAIGFVVNLLSAGAIALSYMFGTSKSIFDAISGAAQSAYDAIVTFFQSLPEAITGATGAASGAASALGQSIIGGLVTAISAGLGPIASAIVNVVTGGMAAGRAAAGSHSPSRKMMGQGKDLMSGLAVGVTSMARFVQRAVGGVVGSAIPDNTSPAAGAATPAAGGTTSSTNNYSYTGGPVNIPVSGAQSPAATAAAVRSVLLNDLGSAFERMAIEVGA